MNHEEVAVRRRSPALRFAGHALEMALMTAGHVLMVPAMLAAMLRRRHEYGW